MTSTKEENQPEELKAQESVGKGEAPTQAQEKKKEFSFKKMVLIILGVITLAIIIGIIFRPRLPPRSKYLPIPYIYNRIYKKTLETFVGLTTHDQILVVTGDNGYGKTRSLYDFANIINQSGHVPILFDFQEISSYNSQREIANFLLSAVFKGFQLFDGQPINQTELLTQCPYIKYINSPLELFNDPLLNKMFAYLNSTVTIPNNANFDLFFTTLNRYSNFLNIVILAINPTIFQPFMTFCDGYSLNLQNMGIIAEIPNILSNQPILSKSNLYRVVYINGFDQETAKQILVKLERVWPQKVFNFLWDNFEGYGKFYAQFHDLVRDGFSNENAVERIQQKLTTKILKATINGQKSEVNDRVAFLKKISSKGKIKIDQSNIDVVKYYNNWGLFEPIKQNKIRIPNRVYLASIRSVLKSI
ncbi:hypothetical protein GPJ56_007791 [Histomonas meleagridis]|uniref:uncharacterized protein n=1 Tax=Histomonas meleagridis TaxID=135588 RepID=UPI00355A01E2|nr:hypothetical protein GPJ56_007791 [Histomonas meleagridis]KAH0798730.1 hypothetical protein GO595_008595 [Histomonas meleagridis]